MESKIPAVKKISAGLLLFRKKVTGLEVLLCHPGGPYFSKKDEDHWSIPKGEPDSGEDLFITAKREFNEETGLEPEGDFIDVGSIVQKGGKQVFCWAIEGDMPENYEHVSNMFEEEWPPHSGRKVQFPEVDKIGFFCIDEAKDKN